jgi:asparagine synthase (glutamine-hydrolysing)
MAHSLESRVPFVDTDVVELAATLPADVKFRHGHLKHSLKEAFGDVVPREILDRRDKMGFPVPLGEWMKGELRDFIGDFLTGPARERPYLRDGVDPRDAVGREGKFTRNVWALLSLELWQRQFHDRASWWASRGDTAAPVTL